MQKPYAATFVLALTGALALAGCDAAMVGGTASTDVSRLRALGFSASARDSAGQIVAMKYAGPINGAVVCGPKAGPMAVLSPKMTDLDGTAKRASLDAYMILKDGKLASGIYAIVLHTPGKKPEGIDFAPGEAKSFASGLTCKGA